MLAAVSVMFSLIVSGKTVAEAAEGASNRSANATTADRSPFVLRGNCAWLTPPSVIYPPPFVVSEKILFGTSAVPYSPTRRLVKVSRQVFLIFRSVIFDLVEFDLPCLSADVFP